MIDIKALRENPELFKQAAEKKRMKVDIDAFLELDAQYREQKSTFENLRAEQNAVSKEIPKLKGDEKGAKLEEMKSLSASVKQEESSLKELEQNWQKILCTIPSIPLEKVPDGKDDTENVEVRKVGDLPTYNFKVRDHVEIGKALDLFDVERGVKVAGARNYFLKGDGALLQHAVLALAIDLLRKKGYTLFDPPIIVKYDAMFGTSYFPGGEEQAYHLDERDDDSYLIGTSEVSVCSYHADEVLDLEGLPKRYAGLSPCFRREAGTYGKDTHGLYRVHQFYKVEQVVVCEADPEVSAALHTELLTNAEEMMQMLELPYRVVDVCGGDIGIGQVYKNDIEAWMPSREGYSETHSCSTFYDFQARRLNMKYKDRDGKKQFCHTLNNTCIASPRILIPLLEVHQQEDGSVRIPEALQPFMQGRSEITAA